MKIFSYYDKSSLKELESLDYKIYIISKENNQNILQVYQINKHMLDKFDLSIKYRIKDLIDENYLIKTDEYVLSYNTIENTSPDKDTPGQYIGETWFNVRTKELFYYYGFNKESETHIWKKISSEFIDDDIQTISQVTLTLGGMNSSDDSLTSINFISGGAND